MLMMSELHVRDVAQMFGFYVSLKMFQTTVFHAAVRAPVGLVSGVLSHVTMQVILSLTPIITERAQESRCQLSADIGAV